MMLPDYRVNAESFHQPVELAGIKASGFGRIAWPGEVPIFHTLCKEKITVTLPQESLDTVRSLATEQKQGISVVGIQMKTEAYDVGQPFHASAQIRVSGGKIYFVESGSIIEHGWLLLSGF